MDLLNKSFIYLFPIVYKDIVREVQCPYDTYFIENIFNDITNTYCFLNEQHRFIIELNISEKSKEVLELCKKYTNFDSYIQTETKIIIVFFISASINESYNQFIKGKYSKITADDKISIMTFALKFLNNGTEDSTLLIRQINGVLRKSPELKQAMMKRLDISHMDDELELSSIINIKQETYNT